ncbi:NAD-dependent epimerase/dehydratase family protein [Streptomyces sp. ME19-01-6]|uniref:NAD-dependent epimerase/dehydratase family protein n=1 Tax=Streptomyces sp. ME19-01-6 TaxID=3028686 RepID=UPI0029B81050|nr:NAD-dependent epimerase/dehydratase family protein [Streptomyces sp. ME19-01-6]MDX3229782.1 NAD-dependent epimerase/dehydratase family protein [Streptomyces sp. ME19-01-6]
MVSQAAGMSVVVLGGTGSLGRHISEVFETEGARVITVSRAAADRLSGGRHISLDLTRTPPARLAGVLAGAGADIVVNAAGLAWSGAEEELGAANAGLVRGLVEAVSELARRPRLVQLGTVHEYGPVAPGTVITEGLPPAPVSPYGRTKLLGAEEVLRAARAGAVDGTVLRIANVYGPGAPRTSLLGMVAHHLAETACGRSAQSALRMAPLDARRDFVDIRDVGRAVLAAATAPGVARTDAAPGAVVNVGSGRATAVRELVDRMIELSGLDVPVVEEPGSRPGRPGSRGGLGGPGSSPRAARGADWQLLDISAARRLLGWRPRYRADRSLRDQLAAAGLPPDRVSRAVRAGGGSVRSAGNG